MHVDQVTSSAVAVCSSLIGFAVVAGLMTITPGLDTALVLRTAATGSRREAFACALGIGAGVLTWAVAAAVGASALAAASQVAFTVLRYAGAAYMIWLGARMLLAAFRGGAHRADDAPSPQRSAGGAFRQGLFVNLLNPKIGAFYLALLPQFPPEGESPLVMGVLLGLVHNVEGLLWFAGIILAVDRMRPLLARPRVQRGIEAVAGSAVVGFGLRLGLTPLR